MHRERGADVGAKHEGYGASEGHESGAEEANDHDGGGAGVDEEREARPGEEAAPTVFSHALKEAS